MTKGPSSTSSPFRSTNTCSSGILRVARLSFVPFPPLSLEAAAKCRDTTFRSSTTTGSSVISSCTSLRVSSPSSTALSSRSSSTALDPAVFRHRPGTLLLPLRFLSNFLNSSTSVRKEYSDESPFSLTFLIRPLSALIAFVCLFCSLLRFSSPVLH